MTLCCALVRHLLRKSCPVQFSLLFENGKSISSILHPIVIVIQDTTNDSVIFSAIHQVYQMVCIIL